MTNKDLEKQIEAVLFWRGEAYSVMELSKVFEVEKEEIDSAIDSLEQSLSGRGINLIRNGDEVMLSTAKEYSDIIEQLTKDELNRDLGKAASETLSIILYLGPITRKEIDNIRGVNSQFILRNLLVRGLVERKENKGDMRSFFYQPTFELLSFMGVKNVQELPEYESVKNEIEKLRNSDTDEE